MPHNKHMKAFSIVLVYEPGDAETLDPAAVSMMKAHQMSACVAGWQSMHWKFRHDPPR